MTHTQEPVPENKYGETHGELREWRLAVTLLIQFTVSESAFAEVDHPEESKPRSQEPRQEIGLYKDFTIFPLGALIARPQSHK